MCQSQETINITDKILIGAVGGIITGIVIPIADYFFRRIINLWGLKVNIESREEGNYWVYNLKIKNCSFMTMKNVYVHVTINNESNDIARETRFQTFCTNAKVESGMLSWSKNTDNNNLPYIDINQGETHQVNFVRLHGISDQNVIEVASEQGFFEQGNNKTVKSRIVLYNNRDYSFQIKITGDNLCPKNIKAFYKKKSHIVTL